MNEQKKPKVQTELLITFFIFFGVLFVIGGSLYIYSALRVKPKATLADVVSEAPTVPQAAAPTISSDSADSAETIQPAPVDVPEFTDLATSDDEPADEPAAEIDFARLVQDLEEWSVPDADRFNVSRIFREDTFTAWDEATESQRSYFCLIAARRLNREKSQVFVMGAASIYIRGLTDLYKDPAVRSTRPAEFIALTSALNQKQFEADVNRAAATIQQKLVQSRARDAGRIIEVKVLKKSVSSADLAKFDLRITNRSTTNVERVEIKIEIADRSGNYVGVAKATCYDLGPGEETIEEAAGFEISEIGEYKITCDTDEDDYVLDVIE